MNYINFNESYITLLNLNRLIFIRILKPLNMKKTLGIIVILIGIFMMAITGLKYVTTEKVLELDKLEINVEKHHTILWPSIFGLVLIAGGITSIAFNKKKILS